jgi:hypothetical protein
MNAIPVSNPYNNLLDRLEGVQSTGKGARARCPSCGERSRKLSLCCGDDGRVLLYCFGGCNAAEVLSAVGLRVADLFEKPITSTMTREEKRELRERRRQSQWRAALDALCFEATVVLMAVAQFVNDEPFTKNDFNRLKQAIELIANAREVLNAKHA